MYAALHAVGLSDTTFELTPEQIAAEIASFGFMGTVVNATDKAIQVVKRKDSGSTLEAGGQFVPGGEPAGEGQPDVLDNAVKEASDLLKNGATPAEATAQLSREISAQSAQAAVTQAVIDNAKNPEVQETTPVTTKVEVTVDQKQAEEPSAEQTAADKLNAINENLTDTTAGDVQTAFADATKTFETSTKALTDAVTALEAKVADAAPRSQIKKDAKIELAAAKSRLRTAEKEFETAQETHADAMNSAIDEQIGNFNTSALTPEQRIDLRDEISLSVAENEQKHLTVAAPSARG